MNKRRAVLIIIIEFLILIGIYTCFHSVIYTQTEENLMLMDESMEEKEPEQIQEERKKTIRKQESFDPMEWWDYDAVYEQGDSVYGEYLLFDGSFKVTIDKSEIYYQAEEWMESDNFISSGLTDKIVVYEEGSRKEYTSQEFLHVYTIFPKGVMLLMVQMTIENIDAETALEYRNEQNEKQDVILLDEILRLASSKIVEDRGNEYQYERYIDYFSEIDGEMQYGTYTLQLHKGETKRITVGFWLDQRGETEEILENIGYILCFHDPESYQTLVYYFDPKLGDAND